MEPVILLIVLTVIPLLLCPFIQPDHRPAAKRPNEKPRPMVGPPWK